MKGVELYARVRFAVQIEGVSQREAARRFGIDPRTVAKMLAFQCRPGIGGSGRRRALSWTLLPGSSMRSWRRMTGGRESSGIPQSGSLSGFATSTATLAGSPLTGIVLQGTNTSRCCPSRVHPTSPPRAASPGEPQASRSQRSSNDAASNGAASSAIEAGTPRELLVRGYYLSPARFPPSPRSASSASRSQ